MNFTPIVCGKKLDSKPKKRISRSRLEQVQFVRSWQKNQMSQTAFCRQHDINIATFSNWLAREKSRQALRLKAEEQRNLNLPDKESSCLDDFVTHSELHFPNGAVLKLSDISFSGLASIIEGIAQCKFK